MCLCKPPFFYLLTIGRLLRILSFRYILEYHDHSLNKSAWETVKLRDGSVFNYLNIFPGHKI